jgi:hypothetical protein
MLHRIQPKTNVCTVAGDFSTLPNTRTVLVTATVLSLVLPFVASTTANAQAPVGPNPTGVPDEYVLTPSGYFHPSCVRQLAAGETLLADGRILRHAVSVRRTPLPKRPGRAA